MTVMVIDYGMSNLGSIKRSLEECGANVLITDNPEDLKTSERIILPGVGSFKDGMTNLRKKGWEDAIKNEVLTYKIPLLGICLGMQLLASLGTENGETKGLGIIPGTVIKFEKKSKEERIPHIGWNEVYKTQDSPLLNNIKDGSDFYFVHSYHFVTDKEDNSIAYTPYCNKFTSVVANQNIFGTQFHPEKSQVLGFQVLKNFLGYREA